MAREEQIIECADDELSADARKRVVICFAGDERGGFGDGGCGDSDPRRQDGGTLLRVEYALRKKTRVFPWVKPLCVSARNNNPKTFAERALAGGGDREGRGHRRGQVVRGEPDGRATAAFFQLEEGEYESRVAVFERAREESEKGARRACVCLRRLRRTSSTPRRRPGLPRSNKSASRRPRTASNDLFRLRRASGIQTRSRARTIRTCPVWRVRRLLHRDTTNRRLEKRPRYEYRTKRT